MFGDGQTSTEENPTHVYEKPGTYSVSLTIDGTDGQETRTIENYITVKAPAGVAAVKTDEILHIFPNPAKGTCTFSFSNGFNKVSELKIYQSNGKEKIIDTDNAKESLEIDLSGYAPGVYFVSARINHQKITEKLLVL